jgi:hypothetical protein
MKTDMDLIPGDDSRTSWLQDSDLLLLSKSFIGLKELDLRPFPGLQRDHIVKLIRDSGSMQLSLLDLTGNKNIKLQDIEEFLSIVQIQKLCLWDNEPVDIHVLRNLANRHRVSELLHPSLFRAAFQKSIEANMSNECIVDPEHWEPYIS